MSEAFYDAVERVELKIDDLKKERDRLKQALQSIAAFDQPDAVNPSYWISNSISKEALADVIANDTHMARVALEGNTKIEEMGK
jgi:hypothetical protein